MCETRLEDINSLPVPEAKFQEAKSDYLGQFRKGSQDNKDNEG